MKNVMLNVNRLLSIVFITGLVFVSVSCSDDDEVDCAKLYADVTLYYDELDAAADNEDCDEIDAIENKIINLAKKAKSCTFVKEALDGRSFDEFIEDLKTEIDEDYRSGAGCLPQ